MLPLAMAYGDLLMRATHMRHMHHCHIRLRAQSAVRVWAGVMLMSSVESHKSQVLLAASIFCSRAFCMHRNGDAFFVFIAVLGEFTMQLSLIAQSFVWMCARVARDCKNFCARTFSITYDAYTFTHCEWGVSRANNCISVQDARNNSKMAGMCTMCALPLYRGVYCSHHVAKSTK